MSRDVINTAHRRQALLSIPKPLLLDILQGNLLQSVKALPNIPADTVVKDIYEDHLRYCTVLVLESDTFAPVPFGEYLPHIDWQDAFTEAWEDALRAQHTSLLTAGQQAWIDTLKPGEVRAHYESLLITEERLRFHGTDSITQELLGYHGLDDGAGE